MQKMALNVAVPLSGIGELFEDRCLLSPISPIEIGFRDNYKILVSPDSETSSGVSSFDSDEAKKFPSASCSSSTPTPPIEQSSLSSSTSSSSSSTSSSLSSTPTSPSSSPIPDVPISKPIEYFELPTPKTTIIYNGRNILDLASNLSARSNNWPFQYAHLPDNNLRMYLANRSQYHRLTANGHIQEYSLSSCNDCVFQYPQQIFGPSSQNAGGAPVIAPQLQPMQQPPQPTQPLQQPPPSQQSGLPPLDLQILQQHLNQHIKSLPSYNMVQNFHRNHNYNVAPNGNFSNINYNNNYINNNNTANLTNSAGQLASETIIKLIHAHNHKVATMKMYKHF